MLHHPNISKSVLWPSKENQTPGNQSAMLNTGHIGQLNTNRLGLILFMFAPTPRSSQQPRRSQSVAKVRVVAPVTCWISLDCHFLWGEWGGCYKLSPQSCHWQHGWVQRAPNGSNGKLRPESHCCHVHRSRNTAGVIPLKKLAEEC